MYNQSKLQSIIMNPLPSPTDYLNRLTVELNMEYDLADTDDILKFQFDHYKQKILRAHTNKSKVPGTL